MRLKKNTFMYMATYFYSCVGRIFQQDAGDP